MCTRHVVVFSTLRIHPHPFFSHRSPATVSRRTVRLIYILMDCNAWVTFIDSFSRGTATQFAVELWNAFYFCSFNLKLKPAALAAWATCHRRRVWITVLRRSGLNSGVPLPVGNFACRPALNFFCIYFCAEVDSFVILVCPSSSPSPSSWRCETQFKCCLFVIRYFDYKNLWQRRRRVDRVQAIANRK